MKQEWLCASKHGKVLQRGEKHKERNQNKETKTYNPFHNKDSAFTSGKIWRLTSSFLLPQWKRASCFLCLTLYRLPSSATGSSSPCRLWQPLLGYTAKAKSGSLRSLQCLFAKRSHPKDFFLLSSVVLKRGGEEKSKTNKTKPQPESKQRRILSSAARRPRALKAPLGGRARPKSCGPDPLCFAMPWLCGTPRCTEPALRRAEL